jgi:hypothetical protein
MRNLIKAEVRDAIVTYFLPLRLLTRLVTQGMRVVLGRPGPAGRNTSSAHGWWRSA